MVEAVTLTTMMVALVRICCTFSLFLHLSRLFPSSWRGGDTPKKGGGVRWDPRSWGGGEGSPKSPPLGTLTVRM